jgi:aspartyl-tRNA(Asn)/glutamyl-tRNA(Gln) amidotransferase subunit A
MPNYAEMSLSEIASGLRARTIRSVAIHEWIEENVRQRASMLACFKTRRAYQSELEARAADAAFDASLDIGLLQGMPISIKDMIGVAGYPTFAGCSFPLPPQYEREGPVVGRLRRQLAVVSGKTHTVQFAYGGLGLNRHWGAPRNPWDAAIHRSPGGSSSGAGVSVVGGMALAAIGTDTAGSVRIPASATGLCGLRPTAGRWSTEGIVPLAPPFDTAGPIARTMQDLRFVFHALDGPERALESFVQTANTPLHRLRVGVCPFYFLDCDPGIAETVEIALGELEQAGATLIEQDVPEFAEATSIFAQGGLHIGEFLSFIEHEARDHLQDLDPVVRIRLQNMPNVTASDHLSRARQLDALSRSVRNHWSEVDVLAGPTLPITPPPIDDVEDPERHLAANMKLVRNTNTASLLGLCGLTLPIGFDASSVPVGLHLIGPAGQDERLVAIGVEIERAIGNSRQRLGTAPLGV